MNSFREVVDNGYNEESYQSTRFINLLREMGITNKEDIMAIVMMLETVEEYEKMSVWMEKQTSKITLTDVLRKSMKVSGMTEK